MQISIQHKLNDAQLSLIKSLKYLHNEQETGELDSLINFYLEKKSEEAIIKAEGQKNYSGAIYEQWLNAQKSY